MRAQGVSRQRVLAVALDLFAENGVAGTSLAAIAERAGVGDAALREQFPARDDVVLAIIGPALERLGSIADEAEAQRGHLAKRDAALAGLVDLVMDFRKVAPVVGFDPVVVRLIRTHPAVRSLQRVRRLLGASAPDQGSRARLAVLSGGLIMAGADPAVATVDDEDLRDHLLGAGRRILSG